MMLMQAQVAAVKVENKRRLAKYVEETQELNLILKRFLMYKLSVFTSINASK